MPGIWGIISGEKLGNELNLSNAFHREHYIKYLENSKNFEKGALGRVSIDKFRNDKIFKLKDDVLVCVEGVILNSRSLLHQRNFDDMYDLIIDSYNINDIKLAENLRGNFAGLVYFSKSNELIIFDDHLANKPIFYFFDEPTRTLIFASELKVVVKGMKQLNFKPRLDIKGAYCILTFGYMLEDLTLVEQIKRLPPGCVLKYGENGILIEQYYKLTSKPYIDDDEEIIIKELDKRFSEAVRLEYEKDLENGYSHIATLSGGLDSRTNIAYAKKLKFVKLICFTFSQNDYVDERIAKKICSDHHMEFVFYSLNNGDYLIKYIEDIVGSNDGLILYFGSAHMYNLFRNISFPEVGLVHTGQFGDGSMGAALQCKAHRELSKGMHPNIPYSNKLIDKLKSFGFFNDDDYENDEIFTYYNRFINGSFNGNRMIEQFAEFSSPFCNIDYIEYAIKIHPKYRYNEAIYLKWINRYIPEFSEYQWERVGLAPKYPLLLLETYRKMRAHLRYFRFLIYGRDDKKISMNPIKFWWNSNPSLREKIDSYFKMNVKNVENYPDLLNDCLFLFNEGSPSEKTQVITLLIAMKLLDLSAEDPIS